MIVSCAKVTSINVWSSGIWISTATGSTAAMHAAGGEIMDEKSTRYPENAYRGVLV